MAAGAVGEDSSHMRRGPRAGADNEQMGDRFSGLLLGRAAQVERLDAALTRAAGGRPTTVRLSDLRW